MSYADLVPPEVQVAVEEERRRVKAPPPPIDPDTLTPSPLGFAGFVCGECDVPVDGECRGAHRDGCSLAFHNNSVYVADTNKAIAWSLAEMKANPDRWPAKKAKTAAKKKTTPSKPRTKRRKT